MRLHSRMNGRYEALAGGQIREGSEDFTGGLAERYELDKAPSCLFKIIQRALGLGSLPGCSIYTSEPTSAELVRLRDSWGQTGWTGAWSDGEWNKIPPEELYSIRMESLAFFEVFLNPGDLQPEPRHGVK
ncbi:hypothetical protein GN956_G11205 [Arapaima gigas]